MIQETGKNLTGSFMWAVEQMKQGKECRRKYLEGKSTKGYKPNYKEYKYTFEDFEATDWEIFEENIFGDYTVESGAIFVNEGIVLIAKNENLDDLERAIKRAKEFN